MRDYIQVDWQNGESVLSALGSNATRYTTNPKLRARVEECIESALNSANRFFVLRGIDVIAAQSTKRGAIAYYQSGDVILELHHDDICNELFRRLDKLEGDARMEILRLLKLACNNRISAVIEDTKKWMVRNA